jgi:aromatic-amino-acid transaminase
MFGSSGGLDVESLDAALGRQLAAQGRALLIVNDPAHNPTGYSMTDDDWAALVERVTRRGRAAPVTVVIDCAYLLYGARHPAAVIGCVRPLATTAPLLFAWSASKSFTHYGLRVGALVACVSDAAERGRVESSLAYSCRGTWSNCNRGGLAAVTNLLTDRAMARACAAERDALRRVLTARVDMFNRCAREHRLRYPRYDGGFFVTVFDEDAADKAERSRERGVYVVLQSAHRGAGALRVALCSVAERHIPRLVEALV